MVDCSIIEIATNQSIKVIIIVPATYSLTFMLIYTHTGVRTYCIINSSPIIILDKYFDSSEQFRIWDYEIILHTTDLYRFAANVNQKCCKLKWGKFSILFLLDACFGVSSRQKLVKEMEQYIHHTCLPASLTSKGKSLASLLILSIINSTFKSLFRCFNKVCVEG